MTLATQLSHLERSELIQLAEVQPELEYLFRHTLIKDAVYQSVLRVNLRSLHRLVGEILESRYAGLETPIPGETAYVLAHHFSEASDRDRARGYFTLAGDAAAALYANIEAAQRYSQALAAGPLGDLADDALILLGKRLGRVQELAGDYAGALDTYAALEAEGQRRANPQLVLLALSSSAIIHSVPSSKYDGDRAEALLLRALPLAIAQHDRPNEARLLWIRMLLELSRSRLLEATQAGEAGLKIARELDLREQIAWTLTDLGRAYVGLGAVEPSRAALDEARGIWRELGNRQMLSEALTNAAMGHFISGEFDAALALTHESYELSRSIGNAWGQAYSMMMTSIVAIERGDLQAAIDGMEEALQVSIEGGFLAPAIEMRSALAYAFALLGFADQASAHANAALATAQAAGFTEVGGELAILAYIELQRGSPAAADAYLAQARATLSSQDVYSYNPVLVGLVSGFVLLAQGEPEQAVAIVSELLAAQGQAGIQSFALDLGHIQARGYLALGRLDEAEAVLAGLRARAEQQRALRMLWAIQALQADIAEQLGRSAEARALRQMASAHIDTIASRFTNPLFRDAFLSQPDVQALLAAERPGTPAP